MLRTLQSSLVLEASGPARVVLSVAASGARPQEETLTVEVDGEPVAVRELVDDHGSRLHELEVDGGRIDVSYRATLEGRHDPVPVTDLDHLRYLRPSRYCESDTLHPMAVAEAGDRTGHDLLEFVSSWVGTQLAYVSGSSRPTDGAVATVLARQGVCRDFAHVVVALLRTLDVPARVVSVYAPGLEPMDFHAVAEALVDGEWWVVDATALAPRQTMARIATGRDAADTAFLTTIGDPVELVSMEVGAVVDDLPRDDVRERVRLG
ncbi:transglutaminase family protein [Demequina sp. SYSU T00192]|uniref:Transglutaminase family protein n=1 Tax=Demequina litoralis TaxID=3051660 RepID=A0ABT8G8R8_9MICO|nr:transglutaminase family protein [Demequina sp. SYSU T00192]MDN4475541.1 transglutaminase family protein [Demequina sp. SYSU T00192]